MDGVAVCATRVAVFLKVVMGDGGQVLPVVTKERRVAQYKGVPWRDTQRRPAALRLAVLHLPPLLADARVELPVTVLHKAARPVVDVDAPRLRRFRVLTRLEQPRVRLAEVVVVQAVDARRHAVFQRPLADALFIRGAARRRHVVRNGLVARERLVLPRRVGENERVAVLLVAEVVGDTLQLQQAAHEVETALLVLHAVLPHPVTARQPLLDVHLALAQQRFHYLRHRLALEDTQVAVALHRPHVRLHRQLIRRVAGAGHLHGRHRHARHLAVEVARRHQRLRRDGHCHRLAQQRAALGARVGAQQRQGE
ncbi:hypothetical protein BN137_284 [Cronobacter condimenti 1330]|uniref:Uncharacterized protein n=1 Tax=Cronobacter condimenti 1330 TaxID=1073999 RepID=K8A5U9_9ENTR|nr:hypothetical protein BN137_284 [Cronobacter condimenti 1330]